MTTLEDTRGEQGTHALSAESLAALLGGEGLPCVSLTSEDGAAAVPASTAGEGLRIVAGSCPVRVRYAAPGTAAAVHRSFTHLQWLSGFAEDHRWRAEWLANGWMVIHPEPWPATCLRDGTEVFRKTGRPAGEPMGSHVVLWDVFGPGMWAAAIEAEVAGEIARAPKGRRFATVMQQQRLEGAARTRAAGPRQTVHSVHHDEASAAATVSDLCRAHPNPGVAYVPAPVTAAAACVTCFCPMFHAGGQWWHRTGGNPAQCPGRKARDLPLEPGDWEIDGMNMTCGYCGQCVSWPETQRSWVQLTGVHSLGVRRETGELVVLAECAGIAVRPGEAGWLAHPCREIPGSVRADITMYDRHRSL